MTDTPHALAEEFPLKAERIHLLKISDPYFRRLIDQYQAVNKILCRAEAQVAPVEELVEATLRNERIALKDQIATMLA